MPSLFLVCLSTITRDLCMNNRPVSLTCIFRWFCQSVSNDFRISRFWTDHQIDIVILIENISFVLNKAKIESFCHWSVKFTLITCTVLPNKRTYIYIYLDSRAFQYSKVSDLTLCNKRTSAVICVWCSASEDSSKRWRSVRTCRDARESSSSFRARKSQSANWRCIQIVWVIHNAYLVFKLGPAILKAGIPPRFSVEHLNRIILKSLYPVLQEKEAIGTSHWNIFGEPHSF